MRPETYAQLKKVSDELADVALIEADPKRWPGVDKDPNGLDRTTAVQRYWAKKHAGTTLSLLVRVHSLIDITERRALGEPHPPDDGEDVEQLIADSRREVDAVFKRMDEDTRRALDISLGQGSGRERP